MNIEDFFPSYPLTDINHTLYNKREFRELELEQKQEPLRAQIALKHQTIISRFMAPFTPYDELLLFHYPGTGKTCTAVRSIEHVFENSDTINKAFIILPNKELVRKFKEEIIFVCTNGQYIAEVEDKENRELLFKRSVRLLRKRYKIYTYDTFYRNVVSKLPSSILKKQFSNSVIVIDEIHNLYTLSNNDDMYNQYSRFLKALDNRKILLMTGTPMKNDASEIASIMNLITPDNLQLPTDSVAFKQLSDEQIARSLRGRVSYLKSNTGINVQFIGEQIPPVTFRPLYAPQNNGFRMSRFQLDVYLKASREDSGWLKNSRSASLFVFPDGSYGGRGFEKFTRDRGRRGVSAPFLDDIRGTVAQKLSTLSKYSVKYANIIQQILEEPEQNTFIFTESIKGGGAIILGKCLERFGFRQARDSTFSSPGLRYAILSDIAGTNVSNILKSFNRKTNSNGKFLRVLIGGKKIAEGFTFRSIQQLHIATPQWNYSNIEQIIARGNRMFAHRNLPNGTRLRVFLHCSYVPGYPEGTFVDVRMYTNNQSKDVDIKRVEYLIKTNAVDCSLTKRRNSIGTDDYSRSCEYMPCQYSCDAEREGDMDYSTFSLYYNEDAVQQIIKTIQTFFYSVYKFDLSTLTEFSLTDRLEAIDRLIRQRTRMTSPNGKQLFVQQDAGIVYLTDEPIQSNYLNGFYVENAITETALPLSSIVEQFQNVSMDDIRDYKNAPFDQKVGIIPRQHPYIQEGLIETAIIRSQEGTRTIITDWILDYYRSYIKQGVISTFIPDKHRIYENGVFRTMESMTEESQNDQIVGSYNEQNKFQIKYPGLKGRVCSTMKKEDIERLMEDLNISIPKGPKRVLCNALENWFVENGRIN